MEEKVTKVMSTSGAIYDLYSPVDAEKLLEKIKGHEQQTIIVKLNGAKCELFTYTIESLIF